MTTTAKTRTYLTTGDIARRASVSRSLVDRWVANGGLRAAASTASRLALFDPADVERWLAEWATRRRRPYRSWRRSYAVEGLDYVAEGFCCEVPPLPFLCGATPSAEVR